MLAFFNPDLPIDIAINEGKMLTSDPLDGAGPYPKPMCAGACKRLERVFKEKVGQGGVKRRIVIMCSKALSVFPLNASTA